MDIQKILSACDHTLLRQDARWEDIREICDEAMEYHTASVCIPPCFVRQAKEYITERAVPVSKEDPGVKVCTVIGFPNGNATTETKLFETRDAIENGADEIDMVINIGMLKAGEYGCVLSEIKKIKEACVNHVLKVIIETCLLTEEEKIRMCGIVTESGADYIKTSTGFSTGGATFDDVKLMKEHIGPEVMIKAAGGIATLEDAEKFLEIGASRLGTSRIVKLVKEYEK